MDFATGFSYPLGPAMYREGDLETPSLLYNMDLGGSYSGEVQLYIHPLVSAGLGIGQAYFSSWKSPTGEAPPKYIDPRLLFVSIYPIVQFNSPFRAYGIWNRLQLGVQLRPTLNVMHTQTKLSMLDVRGATGRPEGIFPRKETHAGPGIQLYLRSAYAVNWLYGFSLKAGAEFIRAPGLLYLEDWSRYLSVQLGIFLRLYQIKRYYYE